MEIKFSSDFTYTGEVNMPFPQNKAINTIAEAMLRLRLLMMLMIKKTALHNKNHQKRNTFDIY